MPGIANVIVSAPACALEASIASRSVQFEAVQEPSLVSASELTVKVSADAERP